MRRAVCVAAACIVLFAAGFLIGNIEQDEIQRTSWNEQGRHGKGKPLAEQKHTRRFGKSEVGAPAVIRYRFAERSEDRAWNMSCSGGTETVSEGLRRSRITPDLFKREVRRGMALWSAVAQVTFVEARSGDVDLLIGFGSGGSFRIDIPFEDRAIASTRYGSSLFGSGISRALVCFSSHYDWGEHTGKGGRGNILSIAGHEMGHVLGFDHSSETDSIMYYAPHVLKLNRSDIEAVRARYGRR